MTLQIGNALWQQILEHTLAQLPEEACGFIAGNNGTAEVVIPIHNRLHSPARFEMDPGEQIRAILWMEEQALEMLSIFHSHPKGPPVPSSTDLAEHSYPEAVCLIVSPANSELNWNARAFWMKNSLYEELPVAIGV